MREVSIYIPCFNAAKTIKYCLNALYRQAYPLKEILVVDDGSSDETYSIVSGFPVRIIRHKHNLGLPVARNTAIENLDSEFIASLDADCIPELDWLENLIERFDSPKVAGVGGKLLETYISTIYDLWRAAHMKQYWENEEIAPPFLFGANTIFRKEALVNIGLYNEDYKSNYEDVDICERFKKRNYILIYEPKARVHHLRCDNIYSVMNNFWKWNLPYYQRRQDYSNPENLAFKLKDNIGLANRFIEEDIANGRHQLLYLDFLLALHHSLKDIEYFILQNNGEKADSSELQPLTFWLGLLDLTFFNHFNSEENISVTFTPKKYAYLQNFLAINLVLGSFIQQKFKNVLFMKRLFEHLFYTIFKINNYFLSTNLMNLIESHQDWGDLFIRDHPNLKFLSLENLSLRFQDWLENLIYRHPRIIQMFEISAEGTDSLLQRGGITI